MCRLLSSQLVKNAFGPFLSLSLSLSLITNFLPSLTSCLCFPSGVSRSVTRSYYRGASCAILVYDITRRSTFASLPRWLADARALASEYLKVVLVGNKLDLEEEREVSALEAAKWASENVSLSCLSPLYTHVLAG